MTGGESVAAVTIILPLLLSLLMGPPSASASWHLRHVPCTKWAPSPSINLSSPPGLCPHPLLFLWCSHLRKWNCHQAEPGAIPDPSGPLPQRPAKPSKSRLVTWIHTHSSLLAGLPEAPLVSCTRCCHHLFKTQIPSRHLCHDPAVASQCADDNVHSSCQGTRTVPAGLFLTPLPLWLWPHLLALRALQALRYMHPSCTNTVCSSDPLFLCHIQTALKTPLRLSLLVSPSMFSECPVPPPFRLWQPWVGTQGAQQALCDASCFPCSAPGSLCEQPASVNISRKDEGTGSQTEKDGEVTGDALRSVWSSLFKNS